MESDDLEDMLFGLEASQGSFEDAISDFSDDEMLDAPDEEELILWETQEDSLLTPTSIDQQLEGNVGKEQPQMHHRVRPVRDRHWVIARIEAMLEKIVNGLLEESEGLTIALKSRASLSRRRPNVTDGVQQPPEPKERDINFPGATAQEAWNFTVLLRILELVHASLVDNTIMTKRDIYYRHPDLFVKQSVVDRYVDDLACTFGVSRVQLNVTAAAKGLVAGHFNITREDGYQVDGMKDADGLLVPKIGDSDVLDLSSVLWVLVIEKEATFRSVLSSPQWKMLSSQGLILTAKGYPDIASRAFLRRIADQVPHIPMYALVDLDPDGIAILSTYKYGSYRLAHEDVAPKDTPALSLPDIRWLGVKSHHMCRTPVGDSDTSTCTMPGLQSLMRLTARDRTKAMRMLEWNLCTDDGPEQEWREELQTMLMLNIKAEMQILDELPGGLVSWLSNQLHERHGGLPADQPCSEDGILF